MPRFIWNDETVVNSYGFRVLNSGISLQRFAGNPVMLNSHENTTKMTLGSWKDWSIDQFKLSGETVFDSARDEVKEVEGQVDRKVIKACSMGLAIDWDESTWHKAPDGVWELVKCELMEVSICAVPSNSGALALFDRATGALIPENKVKLSLSAFNPGKPSSVQFQPNNYTHTPPANMNNSYINVKTEEDFFALSETQKLDFRDNHTAAYERLFACQSSVGSRNAMQKTLTPYTPADVKNVDDFCSLTAAQQHDFKNNHNTAYQELFFTAHPTIKTLSGYENLSHAEQHAFRVDYPEHYRKLKYGRV